jgi:hypothetical protein
MKSRRWLKEIYNISMQREKTRREKKLEKNAKLMTLLKQILI